MENWKLKWLSIRILGLVCMCSFQGISNAQLFNALIPDDIIVQHAGSIGFISAGVGYEIFKNKKGNIDLLYGYVPESKGGTLHIITSKFAYRPFQFKIGKWGTIYPLNPGIFVSYTIKRGLSITWDKDQYPKGYYWWPEAIRLHPSLSNELYLKADHLLPKARIKAVILYSEFNTNDLYLISWVNNQRALSLTDIFKLGYGIRVKF